MTNYADLKTFRKSQVNGLTKHLNSFRFNYSNHTELQDAVIARAKELGLEIDYNDMDGTSGEKFTFSKVRKITREQSQFGKQWLKDYFFCKDGTPRTGKRMQYVGDDVLSIAKSVTKFEFIGVLGLYNGYGEFVQFLPVYRTYGRNGRYFDYSPVFWGEPIIARNTYPTRGGSRE